MAKITAPLLSLSARGQIGETLVFSDWKGRAYARRYSIPANPNTTSQQTTRSMFSFLNKLWPYMPAASIGAWDLYAQNSQITERNAFVKQNLPQMRGETDLALMTISPSAGGGIIAGGATFATASSAIEVAMTAPALPSGWTIVTAQSVAVENIDPYSGDIPDIGSGADATDPYEPDITGLKPNTEYLVGAWFEYLKPNGAAAYGVNITGLITTLP